MKVQEAKLLKAQDTKPKEHWCSILIHEFIKFPLIENTISKKTKNFTIFCTNSHKKLYI